MVKALAMMAVPNMRPMMIRRLWPGLRVAFRIALRTRIGLRILMNRR